MFLCFLITTNFVMIIIDSGNNGGIEAELPLSRLYRENPKDCHKNQRLETNLYDSRFQNAILGQRFVCLLTAFL